MSKAKFLIGLLSIVSLGVFAQKTNIQNTWNALQSKEYDKAKKAIDLAAENEETKNNTKMWYYRGKTYIAICDDKDKYKNLDPDAAEKAFISFLNCLKTDKDNIYKEEVTPLLVASSMRLYNSAIRAKEAKDYDKAFRCFNDLFDAFPFDKDKSLQRSNITVESLDHDLYGVARVSGDKTKAKEYLQKLIDIKYKDPLIYLDMSRLYLEQKDTVKALSYIETGRNLFDENSSLINAELSIYITQGKLDVLLEKTNKALEATPDNEILYFVQGTVYEKKGDAAKAENAYKKAVELKPEYYEANYNLGVLYYERGVEWNKKANDLPPTQMNKAKEYDAKTTEEFKKSVPYFEKANELNASDVTVVKILLKMYKVLGDNDKYDKLKAKSAPTK